MFLGRTAGVGEDENVVEMDVGDSRTIVIVLNAIELHL